MSKVSIVIPARNEELLGRTIQSILAAATGDVEIIVAVDNYQINPPIPEDPRVFYLHFNQTIGQRAGVNHCVAAAKGKYIIKTDGHVTFAPGFDEVLQADCEYDWTVIPRMHNLLAFDWVCKSCNHRRDNCAKPDQCEKCGSKDLFYDEVFVPKMHKTTDAMWLDTELRARYFDGPTMRQYSGFKKTVYTKQPAFRKAEIAEVMTGQGACFFMHRDRFLELGGMDDIGHGSWGQMGCEVACKAWLSGGKLMVNKKTWFAHLFRTQPGYKFPYSIQQKDIDRARAYSQDLWLNGKWPQAVHDMKWLADKFGPLPGWHADTEATDKPIELRSDLTVLYYTDNSLPKPFAHAVIDKLKAAAEGYRIVSVSQKPIKLGDNICVGEIGRSKDNIYRQILAGMEVIQTPYVALVEHDMLYTAEHFSYRPTTDIGYNQNRWSLFTIPQQFEFMGGAGLSQAIAKTDKLRANLKARLDRNTNVLKVRGGFEPGVCDTALGVPVMTLDHFHSENPNVDIIHGGNYTRARKRLKAPGSDTLVHWGKAKDIMSDLKIRVPGLMARRTAKSSIRCEKEFDVAKLYKMQAELIDTADPDFYAMQMKTAKEVQKLCDLLAAGHEFTQDNLPARLVSCFAGEAWKAVAIASLYAEMKINGAWFPLTFYTVDGRLYLNNIWELIVMRKLGVKKIPARIFNHKVELERLEPNQWQMWPFISHAVLCSMDELGARQFKKWGRYATDKYWVHRYTRIYERLFATMRFNRFALLEIGAFYGASLALWHDYFPNAKIVSYDKNKTWWKKMTEGKDRIKVHVGNEKDQAYMMHCLVPEGPYGIIVDDASHDADIQWKMFELLWPHVANYGYYVIEDCHESYQPGKTNVVESIAALTPNLYHGGSVHSIQFHHNICIIQKGLEHV